jgi:WD40 repeat protein
MQPAEPPTPRTPAAVKVERTLPLPAIPLCVATADDGAVVFMGMSDFAVHRIDLATEKPEAVPIGAGRHGSYVTGLVRSDRTLVSGGYDGALIWWDAGSGDVIRRVDDAHARWIRRLALAPDGTRVASVADDMKTRLWDVTTGERIAEWGDHEPTTPHGYPSMLYAVAFSPDGAWLATGSKTGLVVIRDASDGSIVSQLETPVMYTWDARARSHSIGGIRSLAFSSDGKTLAVGGMGKVGNIDHLEGASRIETFAWQTGSRRAEIEDTTHKGLVEALQFGPGDGWLVAAGGDNGGFVSVYASADGKLIAQEKVGNHVHDVALAADGGSLVAVGHHQISMVRLEPGHGGQP